MTRPVAIFDLDRTITRRGTFTPFLLFACRSTPWRYLLVPFLVLAALSYKAKLISRKQLKSLMLAGTVAGRSREQIAAVSRAFVTRELAHGACPGALAEIAARREAGARLILATASYDFYAEIFGELLGFDDVVATRSVWSGDGRLRAGIDGENCYGPAKVAMIEAACGADIFAGPAVAAFTDHHSDAPLLERAGEPVAVNPSSKMVTLAEQRGWPVQDWKAAKPVASA